MRLFMGFCLETLKGSNNLIVSSLNFFYEIITPVNLTMPETIGTTNRTILGNTI